MTVPAPANRRYTVEEYLEFERNSLEKHEYDDGDILAMAGATEPHVLVASNVQGWLWSRLRGGPCRPYGSDLRVRLVGRPKFVYPDVSVICGPPAFDPADASRSTVTNPTLVVEVLSPSTESYDRKGKFDRYRELASFQEYVLVSQDVPRIETFFRQPDGTWIFDAGVGLEALVKLRSLTIELPLAEAYLGVEFPAGEDADPASAP